MLLTWVVVERISEERGDEHFLDQEAPARQQTSRKLPNARHSRTQWRCERFAGIPQITWTVRTRWARQGFPRWWHVATRRTLDKGRARDWQNSWLHKFTFLFFFRLFITLNTQDIYIYTQKDGRSGWKHGSSKILCNSKNTATASAKKWSHVVVSYYNSDTEGRDTAGVTLAGVEWRSGGMVYQLTVSHGLPRQGEKTQPGIVSSMLKTNPN